MDISQVFENWSSAQAAITIGVVVIAVALWRFPRSSEAMLAALGKRLGYVSRRSVEEARLERLRNLDPPNRRRRLR